MLLPVIVAVMVPCPPPPVVSPAWTRMPLLVNWRMVLLLIVTVWEPPPTMSTAIPDPWAEPEFATPAVPMVFPEIVPVNDAFALMPPLPTAIAVPEALLALLLLMTLPVML